MAKAATSTRVAIATAGTKEENKDGLAVVAALGARANLVWFWM
jgi:hypothetical protein